METNRLRQFCVVCETGNLRKAAEMLHLSHSALSKSLKVLQAEIGVKLLDQEGRGIRITDEGKRLYPRIQEFLKAAEGLFLKDESVREEFKIATFEVFSTHLLGQMWFKYFKDAPMQLREMTPGQLENAVAAGIVDVGITYEPIPTEGLEFVKLGPLPMGIFARKGKFVNTKIDEIPFVAPITPVVGAPSGVRGLDGWPNNRVPRKILYRVDMMESGLALARAGEAAIFLPVFVARLHNASVLPEFELTERGYPERMKKVVRAAYLVKRRSTPEGVLLRKLAQMIRNECL